MVASRRYDESSHCVTKMNASVASRHRMTVCRSAMQITTEGGGRMENVTLWHFPKVKWFPPLFITEGMVAEGWKMSLCDIPATIHPVPLSAHSSQYFKKIFFQNLCQRHYTFPNRHHSSCATATLLSVQCTGHKHYVTQLPVSCTCAAPAATPCATPVATSHSYTRCCVCGGTPVTEPQQHRWCAKGTCMSIISAQVLVFSLSSL